MAKKEYNAYRDQLLALANYWRALLKTWDKHEEILIQQEIDRLDTIYRLSCLDGWAIGKGFIQHKGLEGMRLPEIKMLAKEMQVRLRSKMPRVTLERIVRYRLKNGWKQERNHVHEKEESVDSSSSTCSAFQVETRYIFTDPEGGSGHKQPGLPEAPGD